MSQGSIKPPVGTKLDPLVRGVRGFYPFNEGQGKLVTNLADPLPGTMVNGPTWTNSSRGRVLQFILGSTQYVNLGNTPNLSPTKAITVFAFVNTDNPNNTYQQIFTKGAGNGTTENYELRFNSSSGKIQFVAVTNGALSNIDGGTVLSANTWYMVAATYDGKQFQLFLNGIPDATPVAVTGALATNSEPALLGLRNLGGGGQFPFTGLIDCAGILDRAMPQSEIRDLYVSPYRFMASRSITDYLKSASGGGGSIFQSGILNSHIVKAA